MTELQASNTPLKKSTIETIGTDLEESTSCPCILRISGCSNALPTARDPQFEMTKDVSLSFSHIATIRRFSLRPTS
ncbi:hypothetical protein AYI70_g739 [Smittium culicis]|uniref:Uncharacterized protein n=1 Tax=Smittium culicis TaxID=133412 RepID=A0A1R1YFK5_9FUNG|nr:hypothetical protein AYI70_g739 [Smittium culicis]